jgi:hypothetical protein
MNKPSKEIWYKRFKEIADEVREAMISEESAANIEKISVNAKLTDDQAGQLASITGLVMLGFLHPRDFIATISEDVGVPMMAARDIAREINDKIFRPVRQQLKELHGISASSGTATAEAGSRKQEERSEEKDENMSDIQNTKYPSERTFVRADKIQDTIAAPPPIDATRAPTESDLQKLEQERERKILGLSPLGVKIPSMPSSPMLQVMGMKEDQVSPKAVGSSSAPEDQEDRDKLSSVVSRPPERIDLGEGAPGSGKNYERKDPYREPID